MGFTGDNRAKRRVTEPGRATSGTAGEASLNSRHNSTIREPETATTTSKAPASSTRGGLFSSIRRLSVTSPSRPTDEEDDLLLELDLEAALFPHDSSRDSFSPASFKNLELNAIGLLCKFQNAYQRRTAELRLIRAEQEASADEREEATLRAQHFKLQLEDMGRKAAEQEQAMVRLMEELAAEKERKMRSAEEISMVMSEDLGFDEDGRRQKWRKSTMSFDTDTDSVADEASVFSQARSPIISPGMDGVSFGTLPSSNSSSISSSPKTLAITASRGTMLLQPKPPPRSTPPSPQMTTFQKLFKGISGDQTRTQSVRGCTNCQGQDSSMAWDTVSLLRDENKGLKHRVEELEISVGAVLDLINGVGS
jgi:hypothetical protein